MPDSSSKSTVRIRAAATARVELMPIFPWNNSRQLFQGCWQWWDLLPVNVVMAISIDGIQKGFSYSWKIAASTAFLVLPRGTVITSKFFLKATLLCLQHQWGVVVIFLHFPSATTWSVGGQQELKAGGVLPQSVAWQVWLGSWKPPAFSFLLLWG